MKNFVIGKENDLPWGDEQKADLRRVMQLTLGQTVIYGSNTFRLLPRIKPLRDRQNIVVSREMPGRDDLDVARSLEDAYAIAHYVIYILGGRQIYQQAFPAVDRIFATEFKTNIKSGDTYFPDIHINEWHETECRNFPADERNRYAYSFVTYLRNHPID